MKWIAKLMTAAQAVLLAHLGAAKPGDAATPPEPTEATEWQAAIATGTPEALQQFIKQHPRDSRLGEAFELIVLSEIAAAEALADAAAGEVQLSEARQEPEMLEHNFDLGLGKKDQDQGGGSGRLGPY